MERSFEFVQRATTRIVIGQGVEAQLGPAIQALQPDGIVLVHDASLGAMAQRIAASIGARGVLAVGGGEACKRVDMVDNLARELSRLGATRGTALVVLGGGTLTDLAGFTGSIFMRGIRCVFCPTTTLAICDASLGGKNGINHGELKNQLGTIRQPDLVFADIDWLQTLPDEQFREGLVEVAKKAAVLSLSNFEQLEELAPALANREPAATLAAIEMAVTMKMQVVLADEREADLRRTLNFGHTIGHAIESVSGETVRHGSAVAMGLLAECRAAAPIVPGEVIGRIAALLARLGVSTTIPPQWANAGLLWQFAQKDKKVRGGRVPMFVPPALGQHTTVELTEQSLARALS